jgi:hypothetical protein
LEMLSRATSFIRLVSSRNQVILLLRILLPEGRNPTGLGLPPILDTHISVYPALCSREFSPVNAAVPHYHR